VELTPTAYVILGMVSREARSGYEIKAAVDDSTRFFWAASYGQIYPELKRLSGAGLVEGVDASRGERKRTVYAITDAGMEALTEWLRQPPQTSEMREEGLLKLFFADVLPREDAIETLRVMRERRRELAARLRGMEPMTLEKDPFSLMVLQGGIEFNEWFADWCERMEERLLAAPSPKGATDV
jgi:PadR family transcriptional regulator AphA